MQTVILNDNFEIAPDGSEIRLLTRSEKGSLCLCTLPVGVTTLAVKHKTITELWYFLEGQGKVWRKNHIEEKIDEVKAGVSLTIDPNVSFQFCNTGQQPLKFLITTIPAWPGPDEAVFIEGAW